MTSCPCQQSDCPLARTADSCCGKRHTTWPSLHQRTSCVKATHDPAVATAIVETLPCLLAAASLQLQMEAPPALPRRQQLLLRPLLPMTASSRSAARRTGGRRERVEQRSVGRVLHHIEQRDLVHAAVHSCSAWADNVSCLCVCP